MTPEPVTPEQEREWRLRAEGVLRFKSIGSKVALVLSQRILALCDALAASRAENAALLTDEELLNMRLSTLGAENERLRAEESYWRHQIVTHRLCPISHKHPHVSHDCVEMIEKIAVDARDAQDDAVDVIHESMPEADSPADSYSAVRMAAAKITNLRNERDTLKAENADMSEQLRVSLDAAVAAVPDVESPESDDERHTVAALIVAAFGRLKVENAAEIQRHTDTGFALIAATRERDSAMKALRRVAESPGLNCDEAHAHNGIRWCDCVGDEVRAVLALTPAPAEEGKDV